jgi:hypothetical protein
MEILPANRVPYDRASTVFRSLAGELQENWNFSFQNCAIEHQGLNKLDLDVKYQYKPGITKEEYPDFVPIYRSSDSFLTNYPNETDIWEIVNKNLTKSILDENQALAAINIDMNVLQNPEQPYICTRQRRGVLPAGGKRILAVISPVRCCVTTRFPGNSVSSIRPLLRLGVSDLRVFWAWRSGLVTAIFMRAILLARTGAII